MARGARSVSMVQDFNVKPCYMWVFDNVLTVDLFSRILGLTHIDPHTQFRYT